MLAAIERLGKAEPDAVELYEVMIPELLPTTAGREFDRVPAAVERFTPAALFILFAAPLLDDKELSAGLLGIEKMVSLSKSLDRENEAVGDAESLESKELLSAGRVDGWLSLGIAPALFVTVVPMLEDTAAWVWLEFGRMVLYVFNVGSLCIDSNAVALLCVNRDSGDAAVPLIPD